VTEPTHAVFLSYASQDAVAAQKICSALRAAGIEVWFDQSELRGGDVWDHKIRKQIHDCALFIPVISAHTQARTEGYFRLEWNLADQRKLLMTKSRPFLVPVCIDATPQADAEVPDSFAAAQWTRLPAGETSPAFVERVARLLSLEPAHPATGEPLTAPSHTAAAPRRAEPSPTASRQTQRVLPLIAALAVIGAGYLAVNKFILPKRPAAAVQTPAPSGETAAVGQGAIPDKSIAVLPFIDMSEKKDQEYFADGMTEELIDMLSKVTEIRVPARTSSFYFKGKQATIGDIAKALGVANVLEGSVRKSGNTLRITTQLVRVDNGYHIWSQTFDRPVDDTFKVQDEIANAVVQALKVSLVETAVSASSPTASSEAYTLYLESLSLAKRGDSADSLRAHDYLQRALHLDPKFALAWAALAELYIDDTINWLYIFDPAHPAQLSNGPEFLVVHEKVAAAARDAGEHALTLGPNLADTHRVMALVHMNDWNWTAANAELEKARALDPGSARITRAAAEFATTMGRLTEALELAKRAVAQDPLGLAYWNIGAASYRLGNLDDAAAAYKRLIELYPTATAAHYHYALVLLSQHEPQAALGQMERDDPEYAQAGLPLVLDALGRRSDADRELATAERLWGNGMAYQISYVYAARNDHDRAFGWLERAYEQRDSGLPSIKFDPMLKTLEPDQRYHALLQKLKLPQ
jgi:TolB-like protein/tetratricopeptide (TPR) repeat protein